MKAIVYVRFFSDDQAGGTSVEGQTSNAKNYCQSKGLDLAETSVEDGYSAFKGHHVEKGKLGQFLLEADKGKYRGFALVVEQLDRLPRLDLQETIDLARRIVKAGLEIHVTQQNRVITADPKPIRSAQRSFDAGPKLQCDLA